MTDITSLNQKLTELQVKYDKKVKAYGELRKGYKIVLDHNKVLQDKYEELYKLQEKYDKLKEAFNDLVEDSSVSYFVFSEPETSNYKENWFNKAGLL